MSTALDTIYLSFSSDFIESMDCDKFSLSETTTKHGLIIRNHSLIEKRPGLESLKINERNRKVSIKVSSKILGLKYPKGICNDTLEQFICEINQSGLTLSKGFLEEATVSRIDVKNDIKLSNDIQIYINSLNHLAAPGFAKTPYNSGIVFNEKIASTPIRVSFYDKEFEMKQNKTFYKLHPQLMKAFDNILRVESRFVKKETIRKYFAGCRLIDILNSNDINYNIFIKIIANQEFPNLIGVEKMTSKEENNLGGIFYLYHHFNGNYDKIINHIKSKLGRKTKATYQTKIAKHYFDMIENSKDNLLKDNIEEIKNALFEQA